MKTLLTVGTSHMTDMHYNQSWHNDDLKKAYVHYDKGELRWTEYLANKLNLRLLDLCHGSYGIDTYTQRVFAGSADSDVALLEIPDHNRFEIFLNQSQSEESLTQEFWTTDLHKKYIYKYTSGDYGQDHTKSQKFKYVNQDNDFPITKQVIDNAIELTAYNNTRFQQDRIWSVINMIDGYLYSKNIKTFWFSWNFPIHHYEPKQLLGTFVHPTVFENMFTTQDTPDSSHLKSVLWRSLVDDYFIPIMK
jgi:hypothetical protein